MKIKRNNKGQFVKGTEFPKEIRIKWGQHRKGIKLSKETKDKIRQTKIGSRNPRWKEKISYRGLHTWLIRNLSKKERCEICGEKKRLDFANITGEYTRKINDYVCICRRCHFFLDMRTLFSEVHRNRFIIMLLMKKVEDYFDYNRKVFFYEDGLGMTRMKKKEGVQA